MPKAPPLPPRSSSIASSVSSWSSTEDFDPPPKYRVDTVHLTPHTNYSTSGERQSTHPYPDSTRLDDPRSSSTQSLRPVESRGANRRVLLLVYIHGFMGTETSFQSFPAHVHNLLTIGLADSHVVHTKIYPRYQSRKNISYARDAFSNWLTPHESDHTDIILIGHSLGGILAAEVVLLPSHRPGSNDLFQHSILGHMAFDTPFLGMHPGVITTGIASLFKAAPEMPEPLTGSQSETTAPLSFDPFAEEPADPNYNPVFPNDVKMPVRKGKMDQAFYFLNKHYGQWRKAATSYVKSHLEFGGCLADFDGLKKRYNSFRPLEEIDDLADKRSPSGKKIPRVRFVNYYTASTGRIKPRPLQDEDKTLVAETEMSDMSTLQPPAEQSKSIPSSGTNTPRISVEEHRDGYVVSKSLDDLHLGEPGDDSNHAEMQYLDPQAEPPSPTRSERASSEDDKLSNDQIEPLPLARADRTGSTNTTTSITTANAQDIPLPPLPSAPVAPPPFDPAPYTSTDPSTLKLAQKEHARLLKAYERAKKDHNKTVKDREKHLAKLEKARQKEADKNAGLSQHEISERERLRKEEERMQKEKERMEGRTSSSTPQSDEQIKRSETLNQEVYDAAMARQEAEQAEEERKFYEEHARSLKGQEKKKHKPPKPPKKQRDRKFCTLPKKDSQTGRRDPAWVRVYMENMDEVVAHTSLFFVGETYSRLVGDTAERIEEWVREAASVRAVREAKEWEMGGGRVD